MKSYRLLILLFLIGGLVLMGFGLKENIAIKNCTPIEATVTGETFEETYDAQENRDITHRFPIYSYTINGERQEKKASVSDEKTPIGAEVTLYLDASGNIHEQSGAKFMTIVGAITTLACLIILLSRNNGRWRFTIPLGRR